MHHFDPQLCPILTSISSTFNHAWPFINERVRYPAKFIKLPGTLMTPDHQKTRPRLIIIIRYIFKQCQAFFTPNFSSGTFFKQSQVFFTPNFLLSNQIITDFNQSQVLYVCRGHCSGPQCDFSKSLKTWHSTVWLDDGSKPSSEALEADLTHPFQSQVVASAPKALEKLDQKRETLNKLKGIPLIYNLKVCQKSWIVILSRLQCNFLLKRANVTESCCDFSTI